MKNFFKRLFITMSLFNGIFSLSIRTSRPRPRLRNIYPVHQRQPICNDNCTQLVENSPAVYLSIFSPGAIRSMEPHEVLVFSEYNGNYSSSNNLPDFIFYIKCTDGEFVSEPLKLKIGTVQNITIPVGFLPDLSEDLYYRSCYLQFNSSFNSISGEYGPGFSRFVHSQNILVQETARILLQTDKPVYKPKDTVKFRVLVLNNKLKAIPQSNITVEISDSEKNTIKRWKNIPVTNGIFSSNLTLSEEPNLGEWKLSATVQGKTETAHFKIDKYTLPKFRVKLKHANYLTNEESNATVEIRAFYTYGKGVDGNATISLRKARTLEMHNWRRRRVRGWIRDITKSVEIVNGVGTVDFDLKETKIIARNYAEDFIFSVNVTENATKMTHSEDSIIKIFQDKYKLTLLSPGTQRPWMPITVKFKITTQDDIPVHDPRPDAVVITAENEEIPELKRPLFSGIVSVEYNLTKNIKKFSLNIAYKNFNSNINIRTTKGFSKSGIEMKLFPLTTHVNPGEMIGVQVYTNSAMQNIMFNYFFKSGQKFIRQGIFNLGKNDSNSNKTLHFQIPEYDFGDAQILLGVFFFEDTAKGKDLIFENTKLFVKQNLVVQSLQIQKPQETYKPGQEIVLHFLTNTLTTSSILAIRAVDESIFLLPTKDNDITFESLKTNQSSFQSYDEPHMISVSQHILNCDLVFLTYSFKVNEEFSGTLFPTKMPQTSNTCEICPKRDRFLESNTENKIFGEDFGIREFLRRLKLQREQDESEDSEDVEPDMDYEYEELQRLQHRRRQREFVNRKRVQPLMMEYRHRDRMQTERIERPRQYIKNRNSGQQLQSRYHLGGKNVSDTCTRCQTTELTKPSDMPIRPLSLKPRVRKHFPETWIWTEIQTVVNNSITTFKTTLPDTMTSWTITAFALNSDSGLSLMESSQTITTFQPFFTTLNLPYSVIKEKAFSLQVLVHNYLNVDILANVTLDNSKGEYQIIDQHQDQLSKTLKVSANKVAAINFVIVPKIFGNITLNVNTTSNTNSMTSYLFSDALSRQLLVIPDGVKKIETKNILVNLRNNENMSEDFVSVSFPPRRVRGADRIKINVVGDLMGISAENLDNLIHLPTGCGEQNMLKFVPDVVILRYLKARGMLTTHTENKLLKYLEIGYMQQLKFRHPDGSFSAFGFHSDRIGSTWLTAFVLQSFAWAREFINIGDEVLEKGLEFLVSTQDSETGEFIETGRVFQTSIQGGSGSKGVPITAYVSVALQQIAKYQNSENSTIESVILKSLDFISSVNCTDNPFAVILSAYALQNANHESRDIFFELMKKLSIQSPGLLHWQKSDDLTTNYATPLSFEMTSYALLTYLSRNQFSDGFPIFKWLMLQRNSNGGFKSTQDTVVGLMALAKYAEKTFSPFDTNLTVSIKTEGFLKSFSIDEDNQGLQEIILADVNSTQIKIMASGNGTALVQVSSSYYVGGDEYDHSIDATNHIQPFVIKTKVKNFYDKGESVQLTVSIKATYTAKTSMAVVEVKLPPTYTIFDENVEEVKKAENVKMAEVESRKGNVKLVVYYDSLGSETSSFTVLLSRSHSIADVRTLSITAYEYNGDKKSVVFEKLPYKTICDLCIENNACNIQNC